MTRKEIEMSAETALKKLKRLFNVKFDKAGDDILREYLRSELINWQHGKEVTAENSERLCQEILTRRKHETTSFDELSRVMTNVSLLVPTAIEALQRDRDEEAQQIAETMPAIKV